MIENPGDRVAAVTTTAQAVGAKLESFFWSFGEDDYLAIIDAPDDVTAGSVAIAVALGGCSADAAATIPTDFRPPAWVIRAARAL
jgi:uncharacterized protein with GYD domain